LTDWWDVGLVLGTWFLAVVAILVLIAEGRRELRAQRLRLYASQLRLAGTARSCLEGIDSILRIPGVKSPFVTRESAQSLRDMLESPTERNRVLGILCAEAEFQGGVPPQSGSPVPFLTPPKTVDESTVATSLDRLLRHLSTTMEGFESGIDEARLLRAPSPVIAASLGLDGDLRRCFLAYGNGRPRPQNLGTRELQERQLAMLLQMSKDVGAQLGPLLLV
jgi:hypothetical protein